MKCKNLIVITGMSCQGKTYIALELKRRCGFYTIHTDMFYHPLKGKSKNSLVGVEDGKKTRWIRKHKPNLTETAVLEGSHIGNRAELDIFLRELAFNGDVFLFRVKSPNLEAQFKGKHGDMWEENWKGITRWFNNIYNLRDVIIVESVEDIVNFLEIKDGNICVSGQSE